MHTSVTDTRPGADWKGGRISERARCVLANNPSPMTFTGTNTWILSEPGCADCFVVDPGPEDPQHLEAILAACREDGLTIKAVLLTHGHLDHAEGAPALARAASVPVLSRETGTLDEGVFSLVAAGPQLTIVPIPGHSSDSVALCFPADASIVTGDIVFLQSPTVICWPDGHLDAYLSSLALLKQIVLAQGYTHLLSAHGAPVQDPIAVLEATEAHRFDRLSHLRLAIAAAKSTDLDTLMKAVYIDIDMRLNPAARLSVQAQLHYLIDTHDPCIRDAK